jgi:hypothetical protein
MGLRTRLYALLSRGAPPVLDPEEPVEIASVPLPEGPLLVSALQAAGFDAVGYEAAAPHHMSVVPTWNHMRVLVRRSEAEAAAVVVEELRRG